MRILWISSLAWKGNDGYDFPVAGSGAVSGSLFQQSMIEGLEKIGCEVTIISDYPYGEHIGKKGMVFHHNERADDVIIPHSKNPLLFYLIKSFWLTRAVKKQLRHKHFDVVISYLIHTPYLRCLNVAHKRGLKTSIICPDLSDMMDLSLNEKPVKRILKTIDRRYQNLLFDSVDGFVLFSKYMTEKLPIGNKPACVIEGVASVDDLNISATEKQNAFLYAGSLQKNFGIEKIIESMNFITNRELELWIFGDGALSEYVKEKARENPRIKYFGFVDRQTLFEFEKSALLLINARDIRQPFTRYSFPSKTFEYLYSGTPFLSTKLSGVPDEYYSYIRVLESDDPPAIARAVEKLISQSIDATYEGRVRNFVKTKDNHHMAEKLFNFLDNFLDCTL